jgi:polysaccharide deacetylase family protein (PEP-CTERM system associated)
MLNAFTVDLEDWFCVANMESVFTFSDWSAQELRVEDSTSDMLALLNRHNVKATFFVLGWIAERCPGVVRKIYDAGHEIGLHGYNHARLTTFADKDDKNNQKRLCEDLQRSFDIVSKIVPRDAVAGYRAPSFSITEKTSWALETIASFGLRYDSSIFPASGHPDYGWAEVPPYIHRLPSGLSEVPMTPGFGGGFFRLLLYSLSRRIPRRKNRRGQPAIFYVHPWEIDPEQPRVALPWRKRFRHRVNLKQTLPRLDRLLSEFRFGTVGEVLSENGF